MSVTRRQLGEEVLMAKAHLGLVWHQLRLSPGAWRGSTGKVTHSHAWQVGAGWRLGTHQGPKAGDFCFFPLCFLLVHAMGCLVPGFQKWDTQHPEKYRLPVSPSRHVDTATAKQPRRPALSEGHRPSPSISKTWGTLKVPHHEIWGQGPSRRGNRI